MGEPATTVHGRRDHTWPMLCHLSAFSVVLTGLGSILGPLVVWLVKKEEDPEVDRHGRESLNFQISILIYTAVSAVLVLAIVGLFLLGAVWLLWLVCTIMASVRASEGGFYRYPLTIRFF